MNRVYHDTRTETSQEWFRIPAELRGHHAALMAQCGLRQNGGILRDVDKWRSIDWQRFAGFGLRTLKRLEAAGLVTRPSPSDLQVVGYIVEAEELYEKRCDVNKIIVEIRWARERERLQRLRDEATGSAAGASNGHPNGPSTAEKPRSKDGKSTVKVRSKNTPESPDSRAFGGASGTTSGMPDVVPAGYQGRRAERSSANLDLSSPSPPLSSRSSAPAAGPPVPGRGGPPDGGIRNRISEAGEARLERFAATYPKWKDHWRPKVLEQFVAAGLDEVTDDDFERLIAYVQRKARSDLWLQQGRRWVPTPQNFLLSREWIRRRRPPAPPPKTPADPPTVEVPVYTPAQVAELARARREIFRGAKGSAADPPARGAPNDNAS